jgi:hypothetical protein
MPASEMTGLPTRPEGGDHHDSASLARGLSEAGVSLAKLTGITLLVLFVQAVIARLPHWRKVKPMIG